MGIFLGLLILLGILFSAVIYFRGFKLRHISMLVLGGGLLLLILQIFYFYVGKGFNIDLFFIQGNFQIGDFVTSVESYINSKFSFEIFGIGLFALFISFLFPAALEEVGKFLVFKKINKKIDIVKSVNTSMFGIFYVALGFSLFETFAYILVLEGQLSLFEILRLTIVRGILSTLSHILFSVIIGYFYGKALFIKFQMVDNLEISKTTKIIKKFRKIPFININSVSKFYYLKFMATGLSLSILLHALFNFFMKVDSIFFAALTVFSGTMFFYKLMHRKKYSKNYLELKNKIEYLMEMKALKNKAQENRLDIQRQAKKQFDDLMNLKTETIS